MNQFNVRREDQILMSLVHYFVTKENYTPILVQGVKDEIWLQKLDGPYRVIRINSNYIHNEEQFKFDQYKIKDILKQIKKKTMSFTVNALNINLNMSERCREEGLKNIDNIHINALEEITSNEIIKEVSKKSLIKRYFWLIICIILSIVSRFERLKFEKSVEEVTCTSIF